MARGSSDSCHYIADNIQFSLTKCNRDRRQHHISPTPEVGGEGDSNEKLKLKTFIMWPAIHKGKIH